MSKKKDVDSNAGMAAAGLAAVVATVIGIGWWRSRASQQTAQACAVVEESVYRGFAYRIEKCPVGYLGIVPIQKVGVVDITADEGDLFATIDDARKYIQTQIDTKLRPQVRAVFLGASR